MLCGMTLVHYRTNQLLKFSVNRSIQMEMLVHKTIVVWSLDGMAFRLIPKYLYHLF